jgi:hypothetical protein
MNAIALIVLLGTPAAATGGGAPPLADLPECESALGSFITFLEDKKLLSQEHVYTGSSPGSEYSKCRVVRKRPAWPRYAVFRSSNNVTVIIEQTTKDGKLKLYGPFESAYRK